MKSAVKHIPNLLTGFRVLGGVASFFFLAAAAGGVPFLSERLTPAAQFGLERWALILFREFAISGLRESTASRGIKLPVTMLAKWKTTIQLFAVGGELLVGTWAAWPLPSEPTVLGPFTLFVHGLLWVAAIITLWTGADYWHKAHVAVGDD